MLLMKQKDIVESLREKVGTKLLAARVEPEKTVSVVTPSLKPDGKRIMVNPENLPPIQRNRIVKANKKRQQADAKRRNPHANPPEEMTIWEYFRLHSIVDSRDDQSTIKEHQKDYYVCFKFVDWWIPVLDYCQKRFAL